MPELTSDASQQTTLEQTQAKAKCNRHLALKTIGIGLSSLAGTYVGIEGVKAAERRHWNNCKLQWPDNVRLLSACGENETATATYTFRLLAPIRRRRETSLEDSHSHLEKHGYEINYEKNPGSGSLEKLRH